MSINQKKPKILVEIVGATPNKRRLPIEGNKVIVKEGKPGRGGEAITAEFSNSCLIPYYAGIPPFRSMKHKLILKEGASKCVNFDDKNTDAPTCSLADVQKFGEASVIKAAGMNKNPLNMGMLYILIFAAIALGVLNLLVASGNIRF